MLENNEKEVVEEVVEDTPEKALNEAIGDAEKAVDDMIESQESVVKDIDDIISDLEESDDEDAKAIAQDFKDMKKTDEELADKFKEFKGILTLGKNGKLDISMSEATVKMVKDLHKRIFDQHKEKPEITNYLERFMKETEDKDNIYTVQFNDKFYILKPEYLVKGENNSFTDLKGDTHTLYVADIKKIEKEFYQIYGQTPQTEDVYGGMAYLYNEIYEVDKRVFARDKILYDYKSAYATIFPDSPKEIAKGIFDEFIHRRNVKDTEKIASTALAYNTNRAIDKISKVHKLSKEEKRLYHDLFFKFYNLASVLLSKNIVEFKEEGDESIKYVLPDTEVHYFETAIKQRMAKLLRHASLSIETIDAIPGFVLTLNEELEKSPLVVILKEISSELNELIIPFIKRLEKKEE